MEPQRSYLIDTNVLIHVIRRKKGRLELLQKLVEEGGGLSCSVITVGELYSGMKVHEKARTEELLRGFEEYPVNGDVARYAGKLKNEWALKGFMMTLPDMIIAATAILHRQILVTENRKDFPMAELVHLDESEWV
jgi:predicted nucleic acid-binding protein